MKNIAVIFAGGVGTRMQSKELPKQFIEIHNKPILIHTIEKFDSNDNIDEIVVVMVEGWIDYTQQLLKEYKIAKVKSVVPGGDTGQLSIYSGLKEAKRIFGDDDICVLIHDGVRPFITKDLINQNIESVNKNGSAISSVSAIETFLVTDENQKVVTIPERSLSMIAKAPQSFKLSEIYEVHLQAIEDNYLNSIDSCTLMNHYGRNLNIVETDHNNIKITTPKDIELGKSIYDKFFGGLDNE